ncbi:glycosyltransferase [Synechococcus elongatus]|uniref:glycosyltransferase n=1 Tax=Synechococcus elongatus TaxID=32046 RepID=UPI0030D318BF
MTLLWLRPHWASPDRTAVLKIGAALQQAAEEAAGLLIDTAGAEEEQVNATLIEAAWAASENGIDIEEIACHGADCQKGLLGALLERHKSCLQVVKQNTDLQSIPNPLATQLVACLQQFPQQWQPSARSMTIIVPTYNCASKIERTLQSIEESIQFFQDNLPFSSLYDVEVIIVDDASTDDTVAIVQRYISNKTHFQLVCHRFNRGAGIARNTGVNFSQGEILFFCDGDDLFLEKHVLLGVLALEITVEHPQILDAAIQIAEISEAEILTKVQNISGKPPYAFASLGVHIREEVHPYWQDVIANSLPINLVVRRNAFEYIGGFPEHAVYRKIRGMEDVAIRDALYSLFHGIRFNCLTTEYVRYAGNSLDRQMPRFQRPPTETVVLDHENPEDFKKERQLRINKIDSLKQSLHLLDHDLQPYLNLQKIINPSDQQSNHKDASEVSVATDLEFSEESYQPIGLDWSVSTYTGWGVFGTNLLVQFYNQGIWLPICLQPSYLQENDLHPLSSRTILQTPVFDIVNKSHHLEEIDKKTSNRLVILQVMMNNLLFRQYDFPFDRRVGLIFMEDTHVDDSNKEQANQLPIIISGSTWCNNLVAAHYQGHAYAIPQGVDPTLFQPSQATGYFGDRFVIFSGGKLEYRKGQDIVIESFKRFHQQHPDALLLCNWSTALSQYMNGLQHAGYVQDLPNIEGDLRSNIGQWLIENGLPEDSFYCLGFTPNIQMPYVLREAHAAIFPNRAEGGTNLVAMEAIACGIPALLSKNTGHLDLINRFGIDALAAQAPVTPHQPYVGTEGWGQSDPDEVVVWLEKVYQNYQEYKAIALSRSDAIRQTMSWETQVKEMMNVITAILL